MKKLSLILLMSLAAGSVAASGAFPEPADTVFVPGQVVPAGETFLRPLQQRDSVLVGDQFEYGFVIDGSPAGASYALPDLSKGIGDGLILVRGWSVDTLLTRSQRKALRKGEQVPVDISVSLVLAPFLEAGYALPPLFAQRIIQLEPRTDSLGRQIPVIQIDTLLFEPSKLTVSPMAVDTATFQIHDIKGQIRYPVTLAEVLPWVLGADLAALLIALAVCIVKLSRRKEEGPASKDPAYIVALRGLEKYKGNKYWAPEHQKTMYSGITDTLRTYIEARFGINAEEMTTAEIFSALKGDPELDEALYGSTKDLFELSDFVKFAKYTATDEDNARAIPTAVHFVTSTYQSQLETESAKEAGGEAGDD